jgi:hypothetical protein
MWTEVCSSVPHLLHVGLLLNLITYRCLLRVLWPVSKPVTTVGCVLLKDSCATVVIKMNFIAFINKVHVLYTSLRCEWQLC